MAEWEDLRAINTGHEGGSRDTYLSAHAEQGAHSEPPRRKAFGFALPLGDMAFTRLNFLLGILGGNVFAVVGLENRAYIRRFVDANR